MRVRNIDASSRTRVRKSTRFSAVKYSVSFLRSHCHSASVTFMTSEFARTRSMERLRASSSSPRTDLYWRTSLSLATRRTFCDGEPPPRPWATFALRFCAVSPVAWTWPKSSPRSASTMTGALTGGGSSPSHRKNSFRFPLNATSISTVTLLLKLSHLQILLTPPANELVRLQLPQLVELTDERIVDRLGRRFVIEASATERFGNDLVDDSEVLELR